MTTLQTLIDEKLAACANATEGPWRWLNCWTLIADHGARPVVLTSRCELEVLGPDGTLHLLSVDGPDPKFIASTRDGRLGFEEALRALKVAVDALTELMDREGRIFSFPKDTAGEVAESALEEIKAIVRGEKESES